MATKTVVPGLKSAHQMITPECRSNRGATGAFLEAAHRVLDAYGRYNLAAGNEDVTWHLVLVRQEPGEEV